MELIQLILQPQISHQNNTVIESFVSYEKVLQ